MYYFSVARSKHPSSDKPIIGNWFLKADNGHFSADPLSANLSDVNRLPIDKVRAAKTGSKNL